MSEALFDVEQPPAAPKLSASRRLTLRQRADIDRGVHPLARTALQTDTARTCGTCLFRKNLGHHNHVWPKCTHPSVPTTHGAASDCRAWWPGCRHFGPAVQPS